jgi:hypothetical protein
MSDWEEHPEFPGMKLPKGYAEAVARERALLMEHFLFPFDDFRRRVLEILEWNEPGEKQAKHPMWHQAFMLFSALGPISCGEPDPDKWARKLQDAVFLAFVEFTQPAIKRAQRDIERVSKSLGPKTRERKATAAEKADRIRKIYAEIIHADPDMAKRSCRGAACSLIAKKMGKVKDAAFEKRVQRALK